MLRDEEHKAISEVVRRLSAQFGADEDEVAGVVYECHRQFAGSPIRGFIPLLVEHAARDRLRTLSALPADPPEREQESSAARANLLQLAFGDGMAWAIL